MSKDNNPSTVDRRSFLAASAAGAVVVAAAPNAVAWAVSGSLDRVQRVQGSSLGAGWKVGEVSAPRAGAIFVILEHAPTERARKVLVCRREDPSGALARTGELDLFLVNDGGDGRIRTPDDEVRAVEQLAVRLDQTLASPPALLGKDERQRQFDPIDHLDPLEPARRS